MEKIVTAYDVEFNCAIRHMVDALKIRWEAREDAPETFEELRRAFAASGGANGGIIPVSSLNCEDTIYGDPEVNMMFRAWHDSVHLMEGYDFSVAGEAHVAYLQIAQLMALFGPRPEWAALILSEVIGQAVYMVGHGKFPVKQRAGTIRAAKSQWRNLGESLTEDLSAACQPCGEALGRHKMRDRAVELANKTWGLLAY